MPCTPAGIIELLKRSGIEIAGKECVMIGRSNIVGKPMALLLLRENATVTVAHSRTADLKEVSGRADILVVATGRARMITAEYVKPGAAVIDVGMDRNENNKLCGDVDFEAVFRDCRSDHSRAGRRRPHDHRHADEKLRPGGPDAGERKEKS